MFDLNDALRQWRRSFRGTCGVEDLAELESHLREHLEDLKKAGLTEEAAFAKAVAQLGSAGDVGREFAKVRSVFDWVLDRFRALDLLLCLGLLLICGLGLTLLYSAGNSAGANPHETVIWIKQAILTGFGFVAMFLFAQIKPAQLKRCAPYVYGASLLLLILVLVAGNKCMGKRSWLHLPVLTIQPSVLMLLTLPMMTAWLLTKREWGETRKGFITMLAVILFPAWLILMQPDIGMALLCFGAGWIPLSISDFRARFLNKFACLALPALCLAGWFLLTPYAQQRIQVFLHPELEPDGAGWIALQVKHSISSGGFLGRGWLCAETIMPGRTHEYILPVVAEQFGAAGVIALMTCFGVLLYRAIAISKHTRDEFCRILGFGFAGVVLMQLALNVGMVYGWVPRIGVPLPLLSYTGSSEVFLAGFGVLASIRRQSGAPSGGGYC